MITGANGGLGKDAARQLALVNTTEKIYLACRNEAKAIEAKNDLEKITGRKIFEILIMDVSSVNSVKAAVTSLNEPLDALIMNAGGMGGTTPEKLTPEGVTNMFAANVLGHVVLVDKLIEENKLNNVAMYAGSEAVRGVKKMGMKAPTMKTSSEDEFAKVIDGSYFEKFNGMQVYSYVKYVATLWMSSMARKHPSIKFISMSPGATRGTAVMNNLKGFEKVMFKYIGMPILMPLMGMSHKVDKGAARYVKAVNDESLTSGLFYASAKNSLVGPVTDQGPFMADLGNLEFQDNANNAIHRFIR
jgi:NAD(P)-dependent dehydrogenase (short-subunit alcohol dehydrogenase family)